ncbi:hypothetical protein Tco_0498260 [Tanacetum coccineum]
MSALRRFGNENSKYSEFNTSILKNPKLYARNPVKKVLHELNLSDQRSVLMESEVNLTKYGQMIKAYWSTTIIANCLLADSYKDGDTLF